MFVWGKDREKGRVHKRSIELYFRVVNSFVAYKALQIYVLLETVL